eukprot:TRINITY_DN35570_c0_g1_i1.p3 TRINITY_DN35570_c0_g1~~TRINITY_DN35570_c0_g1_i1.p3  ORF type:complete len:114 (+),score=37.19 TRINITY_DN35570_c0_g1_i1:64-405(+)
MGKEAEETTTDTSEKPMEDKVNSSNLGAGCGAPPSEESEVVKPKAQAASAATSWPVWVAILGVAMVMPILQEQGLEGFHPAQAQAYIEKLQAPHVVPPPLAADNEVVIQFCQS